jgi:uncharacterized damage-inducible protein DinB
MPVVIEMTHAATTFRQNGAVLDRALKGLAPEEWLRRPNQTSNHLLWIAGHMVWARAMTLGFLGSSWSRPWMPLFGRGAKLVETEQYPSPEEIVAGFADVSACLTQAFENVSDEVLAAPAPPKSPSFDGKVGGMVDFLAYHDTYHAGQICYLRRWLGHEGAVG